MQISDCTAGLTVRVSDAAPVAADPLANMTQAKWDRLDAIERVRLQDRSGLSPQLENLRGWRVEAIRLDGERVRFIVGQSTGWRPCHLEIKTARSCSGSPADREYRSVRKIEKVR